MSIPPLVAVDLGRRYRRSRPWAVRHVGLNFPPSSITALIGPNGAGKSTLIRACLGFEIPDEGRVEVFGRDPVRHRHETLSAIGYVPQSASLYISLTIGDHLTLAQSARPTFDRAYAVSRIQKAGLTEERRVSELSGGEQAQVALALALGTRARLMLLDEPLASLDPLSRREFLGIVIDDVRTRGATVVLSSHVVADVEHACDRVVVLGGGRLVLESDISEAMSQFKTASPSAATGAKTVGVFAAPNGELLALLDGSKVGRPASLEEIVLGHLARARGSAGEDGQ